MISQAGATATLAQYAYRDTSVIDCLRKQQQTPNEYDACLLNDHILWDTLIAHGGLEKFCCPHGRPKYAIRPWIAMPAEGRRFKPVGILVLPVAPFVTANNILVMSQRVPTGYDGVITDVVCEIVPPTAGGSTGFAEGSGDISWRLGVDGNGGTAAGLNGGQGTRWLRDMGNIQVTMGSLTNPSPVPRGGLRLRSNENVQFFVSLLTGADARLNAGSRIICSVTGWYYPR